VNHRPITNSFRYARQVPTKTPKAEAISKDSMRRGFQYVGPTTIYSFMQVAGIVNDHISCCFRFQARSNVKNVRAEPALPERRLSSPSSEDSDIREMLIAGVSLNYVRTQKLHDSYLQWDIKAWLFLCVVVRIV
jgi:DNA-3-methyladenine glycosylase I